MLEKLYSIYKGSSGICTDTRKIEPNCLFVALKGENFNGNQFAEKAIAQGAVAAIIDEEDDSTENLYKVNSALETLQELANYHRNQLTIPIIGITGSNGKTTTKELIREVLATQLNTFATSGNLNNHIGVPLSLLSINNNHEIAIIEMGANHPGEIKMLCNIADPDYGLITNIGTAHIEGFGSYEGVLNTKKELYDHIKAKGGKVFINSSDSTLNGIAAGIDQLPYSLGGATKPYGSVVRMDPFVTIEWTQEYTHVVKTNLIGSYNLSNIMAAIEVGLHFGITEENICKALSNYTPDNNRSQIVETERNMVIMDAYNANPTSMMAAITNLSKISADKKIALLGDMRELGAIAQDEHEKVIEQLNDLEIPALLVGEEFSLSNSEYPSFKDAIKALDYLKQNPLKGYTILLKGSRGIRMETLMDAL